MTQRAPGSIPPHAGADTLLASRRPLRVRTGAGGLPVVLIVDDAEESRLELQTMLRRADVEIVAVGSGWEALAILTENDVAVVIVDVVMPEMDGFELADRLRDVERTRRIPIIFVNPSSKAEYRAFTGYELGAIDFLFKPLNEFVLRSKVDVLIALERQRRDAERARNETQILLDLSHAANEAEKPADIYDLSLDAVHELLGANRSAILLFGESDRMRFRAWRGLSDRYRAAVDGHSPWARNERNAKPILIADVTKDETMETYRSIFAAEGIRAIGFVPLVSGELLGKFMLYWAEPRTFSEHDEALASAIARQVAQALERKHADEQILALKRQLAACVDELHMLKKIGSPKS